MCCVLLPYYQATPFCRDEVKLLLLTSLLAGCFVGTVASKPTQTDANKPVSVNDGKIVLHHTFNTGTAKAEISSLRKEVEKLRKDLTQQLGKKATKGEGAVCYSSYVIFLVFS